MNKVGATTVESLKRQVAALCRLMTRIRPDGGAVVYVQQPSSTLDEREITEWAHFLKRLGDGRTRVHLKIPPFPAALETGRALQCAGDIEVNVTGIADHVTALRALSYGPRYVSLISGRMEEKGIDARSQAQFVQARCHNASEVIAGSMRTIEALRWVCELGVVPTIGPGVWEEILRNVNISDLPLFWLPREEAMRPDSEPPIVDAQAELSSRFFREMDELAKPIYEEFFRDNCGRMIPFVPTELGGGST